SESGDRDARLLLLRSKLTSHASQPRYTHRRSCTTTPHPTTPNSNTNPQNPLQPRLTEPSDATKRTSTSSSTTSALVSNADRRASDCSVAPRPGASRMSAAAPVEAPDATNRAPSHGLSAQMGRLGTARRIPV